jgi:hypothetical protein|nr:MAG TPA: hypothetical protein [Caudoviricetes sp.]
MESWRINTPASENICDCTNIFGSLATEWLRRHNLGKFLHFNIPDAPERLWLLPEDGERELKKELQLHVLEFFDSGTCLVRMRQIHGNYYFFLIIKECRCLTDCHLEKERCLAILNWRSGTLHLSQCTQFIVRNILSAFDACIGGIQQLYSYNLERMLWKMRLPIPEGWPLTRIRLVRYSILSPGNSRTSFDISMEKGNLLHELQLKLQLPENKLIPKMLGVKVWFRDETIRSYQIYEDHLDTRFQDRYRRIFIAYLALLAVESISHE